jgi:hypothetical protein
MRAWSEFNKTSVSGQMYFDALQWRGNPKIKNPSKYVGKEM